MKLIQNIHGHNEGRVKRPRLSICQKEPKAKTVQFLSNQLGFLEVKLRPTNEKYIKANLYHDV